MTTDRVPDETTQHHSEATFIGRRQELFRLQVALQRAARGRGGVVLLSGEPGVGKTCLANEFSKFAQMSGGKVLEGRASLNFRAPFGLWRQILQANLIHPESRFDSREEECRFLMPKAPSYEGDIELLDTIRQLAETARIQPLILVLDDLQAADSQSLEGFRLFARELSQWRTLVIGIFRDAEINQSSSFDNLLRDPALRDCERMSIVGFDDLEIRQFVEFHSKTAIDGVLLERLLELTDGNPRLLEIALRLRLVNTASLPLGARLRMLLCTEIESHLEFLSPALREILQTAALIGVTFEVPLLAKLSTHIPVDLLDALADAERSGLTMKGPPGRYRFRQTLVREALYERLSGRDRARLHLQIGNALDEMFTDDTRYLKRIAHHYCEAMMLGCAAKAVIYCKRAAEFAELNGHLEDAAGLFEMALAAMDFDASSSPILRRELGHHLKTVLSARVGDRDQQDGAAPERPAATDCCQMRSSASDHGALRNGFADSNIPYDALEERMEADSTFASLQDYRTGGFSSARLRANGVFPFHPNDRNVFRREGDFWTIKFDGKIVRVKHGIGLSFVLHLLKHPEREFHVLELARLSCPPEATNSVLLSRTERQRQSIPFANTNDSSPLLDRQAKDAYRLRIGELRSDLEEARSFNDTGRMAKTQSELECVESELSKAVGFGGRDRKHPVESQRARVNVTNAIRTTIAKIATQHLSLARHLRLHIHTGYFCSYRPEHTSERIWLF